MKLDSTVRSNVNLSRCEGEAFTDLDGLNETEYNQIKVCDEGAGTFRDGRLQRRRNAGPGVHVRYSGSVVKTKI